MRSGQCPEMPGEDKGQMVPSQLLDPAGNCTATTNTPCILAVSRKENGAGEGSGAAEAAEQSGEEEPGEKKAQEEPSHSLQLPDRKVRTAGGWSLLPGNK